MISLETNVDSLIAQQNLRVNSQFQSNTIQQLTSGYRINSAADDAAGLAVANGYRNNIAELNQGVRNANDGVSQLQIVDGGLSNISQILDRMKTLATESASTTFTGDRTTLNNEFQSLVTEINRQASNIGLSSTVGTNNTNLNIYIGGGGKTQSNSQVSVDLSGTGNQVDATGLGVGASNLLAAGSMFGSGVNLNNQTNGMVLATGTGDSQVITLNLAGGQQIQATISSTSGAGITVSDAVQQLNNQMSQYGVSASVDPTSGHLMLSGSVAFTATAQATDNGSTGLVDAADVAANNSLYAVDASNGGHAARAGLTLSSALVASGKDENLTFTSGGNSVTLDLTNSNAATVAMGLQTLNTQLAGLGISAVLGNTGAVEFEGSSTFTLTKNISDQGVFAAAGAGWTDNSTAPSVSGTSTGNSLTALTAITNAVANLGLVQGRVGAGENKLNYAINLAQSQISSFSSAQAQIRDADVAAQAANLTKGQVLQQASIAAMAQANAEPQAVLSLLKG